MYAVVRAGGKQYRVEAGSVLTVDRIEAEPGSTVTLDDVLLVADGDKVTSGAPLVKGAKVTAEVVGESKGEKIRVFRYKSKVRYRKLTGARARQTRLRITDIKTGA